MRVEDFVRRIMREPRRHRRRLILEEVPFHMRERVKREVEYRWKHRQREGTTGPRSALRGQGYTHPGSPWVFCNTNGHRVQSIKCSWETACRRAGIEDFRIHDLRHTCAAWLVSAGVPLTEVRDLLGDSTIRMTDRYAHPAPENVRAAVARLEGQTTPRTPPEEGAES